MSFFESIKSAIYGSYIADEMFYEAVAQEVFKWGYKAWSLGEMLSRHRI
jgi:hypothetical protein